MTYDIFKTKPLQIGDLVEVKNTFNGGLAKIGFDGGVYPIFSNQRIGTVGPGNSLIGNKQLLPSGGMLKKHNIFD